MRIRDRVKELRRVKASELLPNPHNWRIHPPHQADAMCGVLAEIGYADALLVRETLDGLQLIDGHLRAETTPDMEVPVLVLDVTEEEAAKMLLTLDPLAGMAEMDGDRVKALLEEVTTENDSVRALLDGLKEEAYRVAPQEGAGGDGFDVEEALAESELACRVERGQVWVCGQHRVMCGDSTKAQDAERLMGGERADVLLTDSPYGISIVRGRVGEGTGRIDSSQPQPVMCGQIDGAKPFGRVRQPGGRPSGVLGGKGLVKPGVYPAIVGDDEPFDPKPFLDCAETLIIFGANNFASRLPDSKGWIVWDKGVAPESTFSKAELLWTNRDDHVRMYRHVWSGLVRQGGREVEGKQRWHPTQKPVGLLEAILEDFSSPRDLVYGPFLGSGTALIAAERLARRCYGMEIEPHYVQVSLARWEAETGGQAVLEQEQRLAE